ncbi:hypothetical protein AURDEDRAFT_165802 [Auricularia subglabra TFB-10046 SS5]|nr:hypothetical protein AURDEDRAFT_165802 [Auricularia subglabra TFB-10046 SS5]
MRLSFLPLLVLVLLVRGTRTNLLECDTVQERCGATLYRIHKRRLARRVESSPAAMLHDARGMVTELPYHANNELFHQNLTDNKPGVPLTLHVMFMDVVTCAVAPNLWMEICASSTTGFYGRFAAAFLVAGQGGGMGRGDPWPGGSISGGFVPLTSTGSSSGAAATASLSARSPHTSQLRPC